MKYVIDTNVTVAANGRDTHANPQCQFQCIEFLLEVTIPTNMKQITIDESGLILNEYSRYLSFKGQPGVGDMFFKFVHDNMYSSKKISSVRITPITDETRGFEELPMNQIDKSDRMFLAVAKKANADVINALDTDWHEQHAFIASLDITVQQLCPEHGVKVI